jgi:putative ABC transport system ATP-binding protein
MPSTENGPVVVVENLTKVYGAGTPNPVHALHEVSFTVRQGAFAAVMGQSGSGKSTLLNLLGCLDRPTAGRYLLNGQDVSSLRRRQLAHVRAQTLGFVFQSFHLLPRMTIQSNCELPLQYLGGVRRRERHRRAAEALARVGLSEKLGRRPTELSGGQQQRVAIARALVNRPALLLADEPTGNLDTRTGLEILQLLQELHHQGMTVILVTHNPEVSAHTQVTFHLEDGLLDRTEVHEQPHVARETLATYLASHKAAEALMAGGAQKQ